MDNVKLTKAPTVAKIMVLSISLECTLGRTLKKVPPAVPINIELLICIG